MKRIKTAMVPAILALSLMLGGCTIELTQEDLDQAMAFAEALSQSVPEAGSPSVSLNGNALLEEMRKSAIANPWGETQSLTVVKESSGVDLLPPSDGSLPEGALLLTYRYTEGTAEALYQVGEARLSIRKSSGLSGRLLAEDYTDYPEEWDAKIGGRPVRCYGAEGRISLAAFDLKDGHAIIRLASFGEAQGLEEEELASLISGME